MACCVDEILVACNYRWLKTHEIVNILENYGSYNLTVSTQPVAAAHSGQIYIYDKSLCKKWRNDGYSWSPERHVKLKLSGSPVVTANYAHCEAEKTLYRRNYWLLNNQNIVLVHYLNTNDAESKSVDQSIGTHDTTEKDDVSGTLDNLPQIIEFSPAADSITGGTKLLLILDNVELFQSSSLECVLGSICVPLQQVNSTAYRAIIPNYTNHSDNKSAILNVPLYVTDGSIRTPPQSFRYNNNNYNIYDISKVNISTKAELLPSNYSAAHLGFDEFKFINCLLQLFVQLESQVTTYFPDANHTDNSPASFTLTDIQRLVSEAPSGPDDLLEKLVLSVLKSYQTRPAALASLLSWHDHLHRSLLHYISALGFTQILSFLAQFEPNFNAVDLNGNTPLHFCASTGDISMLSALLSYGADDSLGNLQGQTAKNVANTLKQAGIVEFFNEMDREENETLLTPEFSNRTLLSSVETLQNSAEISNPDDKSAVNLGIALSQLTLGDLGINTAELDHSGADLAPERFSALVKSVQRKIRWWLYKRHDAAKKLQAAARGMLVRKSVKRMRDSAKIIQGAVRTHKARKEFIKLKQVTTEIQSKFRSRKGNSGNANNIINNNNNNTQAVDLFPAPFNNNTNFHDNLANSNADEGNQFLFQPLSIVVSSDFAVENRSPLLSATNLLYDPMMSPSTLVTANNMPFSSLFGMSGGNSLTNSPRNMLTLTPPSLSPLNIDSSMAE
jgi:ankyrin repeat protein